MTLDNLREIHKQEEIYWRQRSRLQWLKEGDENTKFFHVVANGRKNQNFIPNIRQDGALYEDARDIGRVFSECFKLQFGKKRDKIPMVDLERLLAFKMHVDLSYLEQPFRLDEIKCAVFELGSNKAPGPDGFPIHFFKQYWDTINLIFCNFVRISILGVQTWKELIGPVLRLSPKLIPRRRPQTTDPLA